MLTDREIKTATVRDRGYRIYDKNGLFLLIRPSGSKSFGMRYTAAGKRREVAIGKYPDVSLKKARLKVAEYHSLLDDGIDPIEFKKKTSINNSFKSIADDWLCKTKNDVTPKHRASIQSRLDNHVIPRIGSINVGDLRTPDIKDVLDEIMIKGVHETAQRCLGYISEILRYAVLCGLCDFDVTTPLKGYIKKPPVQHRAALVDPDEIGELLRKMWLYNGTVRVKYGLRLSAYALLRPQEIRKAEWAEIDWNKRVWVIPSEKMKQRRMHIVPLANQVIALLEQMKDFTGDRRYIFSLPNRHREKPMSENAINDALKRMGYQGIQTAHGFRGMASTILHEQEYNTLHIEMQLAHVEKNNVKAAYNHALYLPQRAKMMQEYADYLDSLRKA